MRGGEFTHLVTQESRWLIRRSPGSRPTRDTRSLPRTPVPRSAARRPFISEEQAEQYSFDILDATKLVPEEVSPLIPVGKMTLNRNPDNFFAETEQVAFCTAHVVPGIDFSNDPLLTGRIHSYVDTQISRLGGPNFHEIPINGRIAILVADGVDGDKAKAIADRLIAAGAVPVFVAPRLGAVASGGAAIQADASLEVAPSVIFDAVVLADGAGAAAILAADGRALEFIKDQYRHCKPIMVLAGALPVFDKAGIPRALPTGKPDSGLIIAAGDAGEPPTDAFIRAVAAHRHFDRETDPPLV